MPQKGAILAAVLGGVFAAGCLAVGAQWIFGRALREVERRLHALAEGRFEVGPHTARSRDLQNIQESMLRVLRELKFERGLARGVFQGLPMPYLLVDVQERATGTNQACLDMLQIDDDVENCLGKTLAELFYNDPGRETAVGKSIRNGEQFRNLDILITGHKGRGVNVLANIFPIYDEDKICIGGLCLYVDMTALKRAETIIKDKNERMAVAADAPGNGCGQPGRHCRRTLPGYPAVGPGRGALGRAPFGSRHGHEPDERHSAGSGPQCGGGL